MLVLVAVAALIIRSLRMPPDPPVGAFYSSPNEDGMYTVFKILAVDKEGIHIRIYRNRFPSPPKSLDTAALTLESVHESDHPGIAHVFLSRIAYWRIEQQFVQQGSVTAEELASLGAPPPRII